MIEDYRDDAEANWIILAGRPLMPVFDALQGTEAGYRQHEKPMGHLRDAGLGLKRRGNRTIALISHALTAHGMTCAIVTSFRGRYYIPERTSLCPEYSISITKTFNAST